MANVHVGTTKKMVFPVLCDGHLKIEYDDYNVTDSKSNFWAHTDSFTIEAIITPYDVNGNGHQTTSRDTKTSTKTTPSPVVSSTEANYQSAQYFGTSPNYTDHTTKRYSHKMMIFYNENFSFYLENDTSTNFNQPAEYKLVAYIKDTSSGLFREVATDTPVIKSSNTLYGYFDPYGYYENLSSSLTKFASSSSKSGNDITISAFIGTTTINDFDNNMEIFNSNGLSLGTISNISGNTITVTDATNHTSALYYSQPREALYTEKIFKVSCVFHSGGTIELYLNNSLVQSYNYSTTPTFEFKADDAFIGQKVVSGVGDKNTQFMGELYEISMHKGKEPCVSINTLTPSMSNILFYYRFGE